MYRQGSWNKKTTATFRRRGRGLGAAVVAGGPVVASNYNQESSASIAAAQAMAAAGPPVVSANPGAQSAAISTQAANLLAQVKALPQYQTAVAAQQTLPYNAGNLANQLANTNPAQATAGLITTLSQALQNPNNFFPTAANSGTLATPSNYGYTPSTYAALPATPSANPVGVPTSSIVNPPTANTTAVPAPNYFFNADDNTYSLLPSPSSVGPAVDLSSYYTGVSESYDPTDSQATFGGPTDPTVDATAALDDSTTDDTSLSDIPGWVWIGGALAAFWFLQSRK